jgi:hypothetical protein
MNRFKLILLILLLAACVDPIDFDTPKGDVQIVLEGMISNEPGPYTIKMYRSRPLATDLERPLPVRFAKITLRDDLGLQDTYKEVSDGVYQSQGVITGQIGRTYTIRVETSTGKIYESEPEKIFPVGEVDKVYAEFESRTVLLDGNEVPSDRFNIYIDSRGVSGTSNLVRWKTTGTYKVETFPELRIKVTAGPDGETIRLPIPYPCSGYIEVAGQLVKSTECECCICWVNETEDIPQVSDDQFVQGNEFKRAKVGEVLVSNRKFYEKYRVEVQQLSLTEKTFNYWKLIKAQKQGAASLFQPPSAKITGNLKGINTSEEMLGLFWTSAITKKSIFIERKDVPYTIQPIDTLVAPCRFYTNSTTDKPIFWQ